MRHFLRRKLGPVSASLHATGVETRASRRALKPSTGGSHLLGTAPLCTLPTAVTLTPITASAKRHLNVATRTQAIEDPIPLVDHPRPACQFLDKRRGASDTSTQSRDHAAPSKARTAIRAFGFLATSVVPAPRCRGPERCRILALRRAQRRNHADPQSRRQRGPECAPPIAVMVAGSGRAR